VRNQGLYRGLQDLRRGMLVLKDGVYPVVEGDPNGWARNAWPVNMSASSGEEGDNDRGAHSGLEEYRKKLGIS